MAPLLLMLEAGMLPTTYKSSLLEGSHLKKDQVGAGTQRFCLAPAPNAPSGMPKRQRKHGRLVHRRTYAQRTRHPSIPMHGQMQHRLMNMLPSTSTCWANTLRTPTRTAPQHSHNPAQLCLSRHHRKHRDMPGACPGLAECVVGEAAVLLGCQQYKHDRTGLASLPDGSSNPMQTCIRVSRNTLTVAPHPKARPADVVHT